MKNEIIIYLAKVKNEIPYYIPMEALLKQHIENNFFLKNNGTKYDNKYYNEYFVKEANEHFNYDYNVTCLTTMFNMLEQFENYCLETAEAEKENANLIKGFLPEKKFKKEPSNLIEYFISSHIQTLCKDLYDPNSQINNYEVEDKMSFSLLLIKKIIKDYSFYFNKVELEQLYLSLKKFKK